MIVINTIRVEHWDGADRTNFAHRYDARRVSLEEVQDNEPAQSDIRFEKIVLLESFSERDELERAKLLRSAWNKLSPDERLALGLKEPM